jgi:endogenous inhibitor of DNA gyrase (YacG/DUF329 family)
MSVEKHSILYAVQFALHEYDETGAVSRRTMEMLGARAILLRYEIEGEIAATMADKKVERAPVVSREVKRKNGRKNCAQCGTRLTGQQRKFCSKKCSRKHWNKNNKELVRKHNLDYYDRQKALGRA